MEDKKRSPRVPEFTVTNGYITTPQRSKIMKRVRKKSTREEVILRKQLWKMGLRYRVNCKNLYGTPDIVFKKFKTVIFVDGDFWHGYNWEKVKQGIKTNKSFWIAKIERNIERDTEINQKLKDEGYSVLRFWTHQIENDLDGCVLTITSKLMNV